MAKKQIGRSLWAQVSYIYSSLLETTTVPRSNNGTQTDPGINADFDYAAFLTTPTEGSTSIDPTPSGSMRRTRSRST